MGQVEMTRRWLGTVVSSWRHRRDETGGVLDETGMIVVGIGAAGMIAGIVWGLMNGIQVDINSIWSNNTGG